MNNFDIIENYLDENEIIELCRELDSSSNYNQDTVDVSFYNTVLSKYNLSLDNPENVRVEINKLLTTYYPNEKIIKSAFIKSHFSKSIENVLVEEFPVRNSRIDLAKFNGSSTAYEIKTDYDNFSRLHKQLMDYNRIFDFVYIIISKKNYTKNINRFPDSIGIYSYKIKDATIKFFKEQDSQKNHIKDIYGLLNLLHIKELKFAFKKCPKDTRKKEQIKTIQNLYNEKYINSKVKTLIKMRYKQHWKETYLKINEFQ